MNQNYTAQLALFYWFIISFDAFYENDVSQLFHVQLFVVWLPYLHKLQHS